jgi:hypothetical protein
MMLILARKHLLHLSMVLAWFLYAEVMSYYQDDDDDNEYHWQLRTKLDVSDNDNKTMFCLICLDVPCT